MSKNILVTGASGFIGKYLVSELMSLGHNIFSFSRSGGYNICDPLAFNSFVDKDIDTVYHLAGSTYIPDSWVNPSEFYRTNTLGTQNVLEFCRKISAKIIYISAYIYGVPKYLPINEKHPVRPNNPYAHSKWMGEEICRFYSQNYGIKSIILRPFNLYGEGQNNNFLIPFLLEQLKTGKIIVKDDSPKRDYLHIKDFIKGCVSCLNYDKYNITFNLGSGGSYSVLEVINMITSVYSGNIEYLCRNEKRQNEIPDTVADCTLIKNELGWNPEISFKEGLKNILKNEII